MIELDLLTLSLIVGSVLPLLVGVVTKMNASSKTKAVVNVVLSFASGAGAFLATNSGQGHWQEVVAAGLATFIASGASYRNLWKPVEAAKAIQEKTANFGLGDSSRRRRTRKTAIRQVSR